MNRSVFEGSMLSYLTLQLVNIVITVLTFGFGIPWVFVRTFDWETKHTVVSGQRFAFNGNAADLFGHWVLWWILTVITFGIYGIFVRVKILQWRIDHTYAIDEVY